MQGREVGETRGTYGNQVGGWRLESSPPRVALDIEFGVRDYAVKAERRFRTQKGALHGVGVGVGIDRGWVDGGGGFGTRRAYRVAVAADGGFGASARSGRGDADWAGVGAFVEAAENHFAGGSLVDGSDEDIHGAVDQSACAVHNHHGAVIEIGDALGGFLPFPQNKDAHGFAGKHGGLQGVGKLVDIQHRDILDAGNLVEIVIVGDNFGAGAPREFDELLVYARGAGDIVVQHPNFEAGHFLHALQNFQAAAAALAFQGIRRIGDHLELVKDEAGQAERSIQKMRFANIDDTAVDEDTGVYELHQRGGGRGRRGDI